jgi:hypothetical protein
VCPIAQQWEHATPFPHNLAHSASVTAVRVVVDGGEGTATASDGGLASAVTTAHVELGFGGQRL